MTPINDKVEHVKRSVQKRPHTCHWPGCKRPVPPAMWGCGQHWFVLPASLRREIWLAYRPGQEDDMNVSEAYLKAARAVQEWIASRTAAGRPPASCKENSSE